MGELPFLDAATVAELLPYDVLVDALDAGHRQPEPASRRMVFGPEGGPETFLGLAAWQPGEGLGIKLTTVFPANTDRPTVQALVVMFDSSTGSPIALLDGTELTYRKTAADSALGARYLARHDARTLLMVGAGGLAAHLVAAHRTVRPSIERVLVWNRTPARAEVLTAHIGEVAEVVTDLDTAINLADVISTATMTREPLVSGRLLKQGTHLDLVGAFRPDHREVDDDAVTRSAIFVDDREATLTEGGDLVIPMTAGLITSGHVRGDLWQLCRGEVAGRTDDETITLFENGGGGHLDLMAARCALARM